MYTNLKRIDCDKFLRYRGAVFAFAWQIEGTYEKLVQNGM